MTNSFLLQIFTPLVLKWGQFCLPGDSWQYLETFLVVTTGAGKCASCRHWHRVSRGQGGWWASCKARDTAAYRNHLAPQANSVGAEKPSGKRETRTSGCQWSSTSLERKCLVVFSLSGGSYAIFMPHLFLFSLSLNQNTIFTCTYQLNVFHSSLKMC